MNIYISLTSIYQKQKLLLNTLNSIKTQNLLPNKCYIFLSEKPYLLDKGFKDKILQDNLQNFIDKNSELFEIRWCENIGPYRKLLPLLKEKWNEDCLILTIDDDIIYHPNLINQSVSDYNKYKCCIAYRGFTPIIENIDFKNLSYVKGNKQILKHLYNFANSGVGTVNHPSFYHKTRDVIFNLEYITDCCKTSDDIWYYLCRILNNIETVLDLKYECYFHFNTSMHNETALCINYNFKNRTNENNLRKTVNKFIELKLI